MTDRSLAELTAQLRSPGLTLFDGPAGDLETIAADTLGVVGMPSDWTQSSRIGTRMGPRALRRATSEWIRSLRAQGGDAWIDPRTESAWQLRMDDWLLDCGDAYIDPTSVERTTESIALMTEAVRLHDAIPLALGGDHYNSYPACLGYSRAFEQLQPGKRFGYIQIDGHLDFADKLGAWGTHNHATNGRRNSELPNIARENMVWIGITGWVDGGELEQIEGMGGKIFSSGDIHRLGAQKVAEQALAHAMRGCDHLYLSIDIDAMDAGFLPGTGSIVHSGLTPHQYCAILDVFAGAPIDGLDIAELSPSLDPSGRTERIAAHMLLRVLWNRILQPV